MPVRIQRSRAKGWHMPEGAIYVGRPGPWGNPFVVGRDGTAAYCVDLYRYLLANLICLSTPNIDEQRAALAYAKAHIGALRGKDLACWCRSGQVCHADVLLELANAEKSC